jgi:predicted RNase H-like HicB family nuclease
VIDPSRYPAQVFWSDEDEGFIAIAPDLPGCSSFGETQAEALAELQPAIEAWIQAARAANNPIPGPSDPAQRAQYSGKVLVRMPRVLHARLVGAAEVEEVSLNQYIVYLLSTASAHVAKQQQRHSREVVQQPSPYRVVCVTSLVFNTGRQQEVKPVHIDVDKELVAVTTGKLMLEEKHGGTYCVQF